MGCGPSREENHSPLSQSYKIEVDRKAKRGGQLSHIEKILRFNRPKISSEIDVIQWDRFNSGKNHNSGKLNNVFGISKNPNESIEDLDDDPDIVRYGFR